MQVDVIVYLSGRGRHLHECVDAIAKYTPDKANVLFIADIVSPSLNEYLLGVRTKLKSGRRNVGLLVNHTPIGYVASINKGIKSTKSPYLVVLNEDTIVTKDWIDRLGKCLLSEPSLAIACPFINGGFRQAFCEKIPEDLTINAFADFVNKTSKNEYPRITSADACLFIKREILPKVGMFREVIFPEVDFCHRVRQQGYGVAVADDLFVYYYKTGRSPQVHDDKIPDGSYLPRVEQIPAPTPTLIEQVEEESSRLIRLPTRRLAKVVSIIVPVHNQLKMLKKCIRSVVAKSSTPYKIVIVNDGSNDTTTNYCKKLYETGIADAYIHNKKSVGFSKACNQGIQALKSDFYCLLNSDTVVGTDEWLSKIVKSAEKMVTPPGILGVLSNRATSQSIVKSGELPAGFSIDQFAQLIDKVTESRNPEVRLVHGFCYIIQDEVIKTIGYLDDVMFPHYGSEDDYTMRAFKGGYRPIIVDSVFIYHEGRASYGDSRTPLVTEAIRRLRKKWGRDTIQEAMIECENSLKYIQGKIKRYT